jgi:hypothetical protein
MLPGPASSGGGHAGDRPARRIAMTAAFVALSLGVAIHSVGQAPYDSPPTTPVAMSAPYWIPRENGLVSVPYSYPYQKRRAERGFHHHDYILPPGPGDGWGFPNGFPDGYGWVDYGPYLPLGGDRNSEYFFPRYYVVPPEQMFLPTYYNPYVTRGQRYLPFAGGGGAHPAGGPPISSAEMAVRPFSTMPGRTPAVAVPRLNGRAEAPFVNSGTSGLTP